MFHDNDSQHVVNLDYQLVKKQLAFMITKTFFIPCYSIKCDLSLDNLKLNIMHYIIVLTNNSLSKVTLNEQTNLNFFFNITRMLSFMYYWKCKTDILYVTYTVLTNI